MVGSMPLNLILSLVFGVGQMVVGGWLALHMLRQENNWRKGVMFSVGLWFVVSGVIELLVSGMETSQRLTGSPIASVFALWRTRADTALTVATVALFCGAIVYPVALQWRGRTRAGTETGVEGEPGA